jgi:Zn-dependent protease
MLKRSYELTRVMGIPIRIHLALIVLLAFVAFRFGLPGILYAATIFLSVALHELGHSWVAIRKGSRVHEILLLPIGGVAKMSGVPTRPRDEALIAAAGPAVSALLALLSWGLVIGTEHFGAPQIAALLVMPFIINTMLCLFNLVPAFPMDGGRIFRALMTPRLGRIKATALAVRIGRILAVVGGVWALMNREIFLILIAVYIYQAAGAEYRAVFAQQTPNQWVRPDEQGIDAEVSPPPYAQASEDLLKTVRAKATAFFQKILSKRPIR